MGLFLFFLPTFQFFEKLLFTLSHIHLSSPSSNINVRFPDAAARPRKRPPPPVPPVPLQPPGAGFPYFKHCLSPPTEEEEGAKRGDGLIPLMPRCRLKSFVSHPQTWRRQRLPPPTVSRGRPPIHPSLSGSLCASL